MSEVTSIDESAGDLQPIAEIIAAAIIAAASRSQMLLPFPTRLARLGRELRGEAFRPMLVRPAPAPRAVGGDGHGP